MARGWRVVRYAQAILFPNKAAGQILLEMDPNKDNRITFDEFLAMASSAPEAGRMSTFTPAAT